MSSIPGHPLKILVVGSGGREHALVWKLAQSKLVDNIFCAPGNGGTAKENKTKNIDIQITDFDKLSQFCLDKQIDLTVVGPDNALAEGIVDHFLDKGLKTFGPTKAASKLEWSKSYAKQFMQKYNIPTAKFKICTTYSDSLNTLKNEPWAQIIKVDGLALGKGVYICNDKNEGKQALKEIFEDNKFGQAGEAVIFEEKLNGEEISLFLLCDGKNFIPLEVSQDNKRRFNNDKGPNTGGMGAISPPAIYKTFENEISKTIVEPLMQALIAEKINYTGLLYLGILLDRDSNTNVITAKILEFNARFGDPETQAVILRLQSDLLPALWSCTDGTLNDITLTWKDKASCCVVAVTKDYPERSSQGKYISLPQNDKAKKDTVIFHAGTKLIDNQLVTSGGRILAVTALGEDLNEAAKNAYDCLKEINFDAMDYRNDIVRSMNTMARLH